MKKMVLLMLAGVMLIFTACGNEDVAQITDTAVAKAAEEESKGIEISNSLFTITLPAECEGTYEAETTDSQILIYHKESKDAGYGGLAFIVWAREFPSEFAGGPYVKVGELKDSTGKRYEMELGYATEIQWNFEESEAPPEDYERLYNAAGDIVRNIIGVNGATYEYGAGTNGADLYGAIVEKYIAAYKEGWDASDYEENGMSPEFYNLTHEGGLAYVGIAYYDENKDGIDELFVGSLNDGELKGVTYDVYTMVDDTPELVVSGNARDRYYILYNAFLVNEYSGGALENEKLIYDISPNSTELVLQWGTKFDAYENENQPWYITYDGENWDNVSEEDYAARAASSDDYTALEFIPLSEF